MCMKNICHNRKALITRYTHDRDTIGRHNPHARSSRFSRYKNRDRFRQERHTVERERNIDRYPRHRSEAIEMTHLNPRVRVSSVRENHRAHSMARDNERPMYEDPSSRHPDHTRTLPTSRNRRRNS